MIDPLMFIALLPAVVLVVYICRKDRTDKEPPTLIAKLLGYGVLRACRPLWSSSFSAPSSSG